MQLQLHYTNYTTPQLQLHYTTITTTAALHHTTSSSCGWGDRPVDHCNHCSHSKKHSSNHLSVHQWICSAIRDSQQPISPIGFLFLKLPPPWYYNYDVSCIKDMWYKCYIQFVVSKGTKNHKHTRSHTGISIPWIPMDSWTGTKKRRSSRWLSVCCKDRAKWSDWSGAWENRSANVPPKQRRPKVSTRASRGSVSEFRKRFLLVNYDAFRCF